ncbi:uncharacterized protein LOC62_05G007672 [Vanrija pseudolonga]|uniref:ER membrane protein complex subunit 6 n=1 Tax=Vanrija pseudolonga TaxID=143232 RepID=A0AAF0YGE7_9TREE|nr:hypothetical protein LOC62_05G007672 [Vanrija pseudolonga]
MDPSAAPISKSQFSPAASALYPPSATHNTSVIGSVATLTACFSGAIAGILGLTNLTGFALYLATAVATGVTVAAVKCNFDVGKYSPQAHSDAGPQGAVVVASWKGWVELMGLGQENLLGFLLFWIGGYALIHVYD